MYANTISVVSLAVEPIHARTWTRLEAVLDRTERARAAKFVFEQDRRAYVAAHALLRHVLSERTRIEPTAWRFAESSYGKPFLKGQSGGLDLRFSLSHARSMVVVAVALGVDVGVDVEPQERAASLDLDIADSYLAPNESAMLHSLPRPPEQRERFLVLWTLKEAVIKTTGSGLSQSLKGFSIGFDPLCVTVHDIADKSLKASGRASWRLAHWLHRDHHIAAATRWPEGNPVFEHREVELPSG